jgi:hypothetical protein
MSERIFWKKVLPRNQTVPAVIHVQDVVLLEQEYTDFQKSGSHQTLVRPSKVICNNHHTGETQILGATVQNVLAQATWSPESVHPCSGI